LPIADTSSVCDIGGAQLDDDARAWRRPQIEPRQYHILHCIPNSQVRVLVGTHTAGIVDF
jgi:hypothetical protein